MFGKTLTENQSLLRSGIQQPYLVIEDALLPDVADQLYQELMGSDSWEKSDRSSFTEKEQALIPEGYSFTREIINLDSGKLSPSVKKLYDYLNSEECLHWVSDFSGRKCDAFTGACARYYGGHHLTSHNDYYMKKMPDDSVVSRTVTFNYYLTRDWDPSWGGNFIWEKPYEKLTPKFNTLVMFFVGIDSMHHVEKVREDVHHPRLAITGWFTTKRDRETKLNITEN